MGALLSDLRDPRTKISETIIMGQAGVAGNEETITSFRGMSKLVSKWTKKEFPEFGTASGGAV